MAMAHGLLRPMKKSSDMARNIHYCALCVTVHSYYCPQSPEEELFELL
jgi:hypothetical protein